MMKNDNSREKYFIYCEMFDKCKELEDIIRNSLNKHCARIYNIEVYVGNEETRQYTCYIEYKGTSYHNYNGVMMTEEQIRKYFI